MDRIRGRMASPSEKLAQSLEVLRRLQDDDAQGVIRSNQITRTHKERLLANGFIREVLKGWYLVTRPQTARGSTTFWYTSYWQFIGVYLRARFGTNWCLSPEQSLRIHAGDKTVPSQILVRSPKGKNRATDLIFGTSIFELRGDVPPEKSLITCDGLLLHTLQSGLVGCGPDFFSKYATDARTCLSMVKDPSGILELLLEGGHSVRGGRLVGAFRNVGLDNIAKDIEKTMKAVGYDVRTVDPFTDTLPLNLEIREPSPYATRIKIMWSKMRVAVESECSDMAAPQFDQRSFLKQVEEGYADDAYHSLSIEGYRVNHALIERVRSGDWDPDANANDSTQKNAIAARGYYLAFKEVEQSIARIFDGANRGTVLRSDLATWYRALFTPLVTAGLLKASDLAGYRCAQVFIQNSMHIPVRSELVPDAVGALTEMLRDEKNALVRAILGHFVFTYIHPYLDGNGRIARFLMNTMLASGGYPWIVVPVEKREIYMSALELASVQHDIVPFARFLKDLIKAKIADYKKTDKIDNNRNK